MTEPLDELDAMIAQGWGDVDRDKIPDDWRTRRGPCRVEMGSKQRAKMGGAKPGPKPREVRDRLHAEAMERNLGRQRRLADARLGRK